MSGFEDFIFKYVRFILISIILMLLIISGEKIRLAIDKRQSSETQTYTTVEDKYIQTRGKITNYYAKVKVGDYKKLEVVQITSEQYEAISKGSKILCTVYLKKDKILDVEFAEVHGRE
jgi:hypothetical protein